MKEETEKILTDAIINLGVGMRNLQKEMKAMRMAQEGTNKRLDKLESQQIKTNLFIQELRLSVERLDKRMFDMEDSFNKYAQRNDDRANNHDTRIARLENHSSIVNEPKAIYKKVKKNEKSRR